MIRVKLGNVELGKLVLVDTGGVGECECVSRKGFRTEYRAGF